MRARSEDLEFSCPAAITASASWKKEMDPFHMQGPFRILVTDLARSITDQSITRSSNLFHPERRIDSDSTRSFDPIQHQSPFPDSLSTILAYVPSILISVAILWKVINPKFHWLPKSLSSFISTFSSFVNEDELERTKNPSLDPSEVDVDSDKGFERQRKRVEWMIIISLVQCVGWSTRLGWAIITESKDPSLRVASSLFSWVSFEMNCLQISKS